MNKLFKKIILSSVMIAGIVATPIVALNTTNETINFNNDKNILLKTEEVEILETKIQKLFDLYENIIKLQNNKNNTVLKQINEINKDLLKLKDLIDTNNQEKEKAIELNKQFNQLLEEIKNNYQSLNTTLKRLEKQLKEANEQKEVFWKQQYNGRTLSEILFQPKVGDALPFAHLKIVAGNDWKTTNLNKRKWVPITKADEIIVNWSTKEFVDSIDNLSNYVMVKDMKITIKGGGISPNVKEALIKNAVEGSVEEEKPLTPWAGVFKTKTLKFIIKKEFENTWMYLGKLWK